MDEHFLQVFIDGVKRYFASTSPDQPVEVGVPYLIPAQRRWQHDITGIIQISGQQPGLVCFSAPRILLRRLLMAQGEFSAEPELCADLVGEVANTIAGNARISFGREFNISTPQVLEGYDLPQEPGQPEQRAYLIPLDWNNYRASLMISRQAHCH